MSSLSIKLFGTVPAMRNERPIKLATEKCRALLAYLAVEDGLMHRREALAMLLWPQQSERAARTNLRQTLHLLRKAIGDIGNPNPQLLITTREIQLNPTGDLWLDSAEFDFCLQTFRAHCANGLPLCANCHEALKRAAALYQGEFMAGFSIAASPSFELWLLNKQEAYRRQILEVLGRLGGFYEATGDFGRAARCARRLVALEPWRESSHRLLMHNLAQAGQERAALTQYERFRQLLAEDLGIEPSKSTRQLFERIRDNKSSTMRRRDEKKNAGSWPGPRDDAQTLSSAPAPFVGRESELAILAGYLEQALAGQGRVLFISGEAGSGKTSLAAAFCRHALTADETLLVTYGRCDGQHGLGDPFQPFREALRLLDGQAGEDLAWLETGEILAQRLHAARPVIKRSLVEKGPDLPGTLLPAGSSTEQRPGLLQTALFEQVTGFFRDIAQNRPLIVILDDLHWIDAASASLLFHLGRHLAGSRLLIVGAYRPEEVRWFGRGTPGMSRHPLVPVVNGLQRIYGDVHIDLDQADGRAFVEAYVDSEPNHLDERFRNSLHKKTGGNPLFTVEMLLGLKNRAELVQNEAGYWAIDRELDWEQLPARVEAVIAERHERLTSFCKATMAAASVQGQTFLAEVVAAAGSKEAEPVIQCLSNVLGPQHRLIRAGSRENYNGQMVSRFRFRHHLFQKFAYQQLNEVARSRLHEATGFALERLYANQIDDYAAELAHHFAAAGQAQKAAGYLLQAGQRAYMLSANAAAISYFRQGLDLLETLPATEDAGELERRARQELTMLMALVALLRAGQGYAAAENLKIYTRVRDLARQIGDSDSQFMAQLLMWTSYLTQADYARALDISLQLHNQVQTTVNRSQIPEAKLALGIVRLYQGEFDLALKELEVVMRNHDRQDHDPLLSLFGQNIGLAARIWLAKGLWFVGYPEQALRQSQLAISQTESLDRPYTLAMALTISGCAIRLMRGEYAIAGEQSERLLRLAADEGFDLCAAWARIYQGRAQLFLGQKSEGLANLQRGLAACQDLGHQSNMTFGLALLAEAGVGDRDQGEVLLEALEMAAKTDERFFAAELHRLRGEHLLQVNDKPAAEVCFQESLETARRQGAKSLELRAAMSLARLWQRQGRRREAHRLLDGVFGWFSEGFETADLQEAQQLLLEL